MIKKYRRLVIELTQYILEQYWQKNPEPLMNHMHDEALWIGSMDEEYIHGKKLMEKRIYENSNEMPHVYLDNQEYEAVQNEGNTCVVAGRYRAYTKPDSGMLLSEKQRVTFVWEKIKIGNEEKFFIKHIHLSNILHIQSEDERFPTKAGKENYEYVKRIMAERSVNDVVTVKDENLVNRVINYSDIMYIVSDRNYIRLSLTHGQGSIKVRGNLSTFVEQLPAGFLRVSRSYCINKSYVKLIHGHMLVMIDGKEFQIPNPIRKQICVAINKK